MFLAKMCRNQPTTLQPLCVLGTLLALRLTGAPDSDRLLVSGARLVPVLADATQNDARSRLGSAHDYLEDEHRAWADVVDEASPGGREDEIGIAPEQVDKNMDIDQEQEKPTAMLPSLSDVGREVFNLALASAEDADTRDPSVGAGGRELHQQEQMEKRVLCRPDKSWRRIEATASACSSGSADAEHLFPRSSASSFSVEQGGSAARTSIISSFQQGFAKGYGKAPSPRRPCAPDLSSRSPSDVEMTTDKNGYGRQEEEHHGQVEEEVQVGHHHPSWFSSPAKLLLMMKVRGCKPGHWKDLTEEEESDLGRLQEGRPHLWPSAESASGCDTTAGAGQWSAADGDADAKDRLPDGDCGDETNTREFTVRYLRGEFSGCKVGRWPDWMTSSSSASGSGNAPRPTWRSSPTDNEE